ncbi:hypothetical protein LY78DRAFT_89219 [Colletotrichum sublineola]|nr:hypothetical protein LY78DRAFT_89219 [Colletotrichum sublineola]
MFRSTARRFPGLGTVPQPLPRSVSRRRRSECLAEFGRKEGPSLSLSLSLCWVLLSFPVSDANEESAFPNSNKKPA